MRNAPSLQTHSELEGASEQAAAHAVSRRWSLLHLSPLPAGALSSLQYQAMEVATAQPSSVLSWLGALGSSTGHSLSLQWKYILMVMWAPGSHSEWEVMAVTLSNNSMKV